MRLLTAILCLAMFNGNPYVSNAVENDSSYVAMDVKKKKKKGKKVSGKGKKKKKGFFSKVFGAK